MFHLLAYTSGALVTATPNFDVPALNDDIFVIATATNHFLMDDVVSVLAAFASAVTLDRARIVLPSYRNLGLPFIRPMQVGVLPASDPNVARWLDNPITLGVNEDVAIEATVAAVGPERGTFLLWVAKQLESIPGGQIFPLRFTSVTAAVANAWTTLQITLDQALPPGRYALVMSEVLSTNGIAHRWIVPNQLYRPGQLSFATTGLRTHKMFFEYELGLWGTFQSTTLPRLQVLCNGADAAHTGYMYVVPLDGQDRRMAA